MEALAKLSVIVVGVDFSECGDMALEQAFSFAAERKRAEVHAVSALVPYNAEPLLGVPASANPFPPGLLQAAGDRLRVYVDTKLEEFTKQRGLTEQPFERAVSHVRIDVPAEAITQLASDVDADLVVVGTHGRRGISRLLLGSVAEAVVRTAPCPVLVVRTKVPGLLVPKIEPPCPRCVEVRKATGGAEFWCEQHRQHHGPRHTYHQADRASAETNFPLVVR